MTTTVSGRFTRARVLALLLASAAATASWATAGGLPNGVVCGAATDCASGFCAADDTCCDGPCDGSCVSCRVKGHEGTCTALSAGSPGDPLCAPYLCGGTGSTCPTSCTTNAQCASGAVCNNHLCAPSGENGVACSDASQCASGFCVDGVCCDTFCGGGDPNDCQACAFPVRPGNGTCGVVAKGTTCRAAVDVCDVAETCDGVSPFCPDDAFAAAGTVCRPSVRLCDTAETCTGDSSSCPGDGPTCAGPDADGDGITDDMDQCPGTDFGAPTDGAGCSSAQRLATTCPVSSRGIKDPLYRKCVRSEVKAQLGLGLIGKLDGRALLAGKTDVPCLNGGFDLGNFTGWVGYTGNHHIGTFGASVLSLSPSGIVMGRHTIMTGSGFDPQLSAQGVNLPVVFPLGAPYSVRLGNSDIGAQAEALRYTFTVTPATAAFHYNYAVVLQDPGHERAKQPLFRVRACKGSSCNLFNTISTTEVAADRNNPYFKVAGPELVYKPWSCDVINLAPYMGKKVSVEFTTADCTEGGHFGYAYIDSLCRADDIFVDFTMPTDVCTSDEIMADGSASQGETDYFWSIEESDANGGRNPSTEVSQWFQAAQAGVIDLKAFYASKGGTFKCDHYYRIKLAARNNCVGWRETVKLLHTKPCPNGDAGPNHEICCTIPDPSVQLGPAFNQAATYSWTSDPPGFSSTDPNPIVRPTGPTTYFLTVTGANGCSATGRTQVLIDAPFHVDLMRAESSFPCSRLALLEPIVTTDDSGCVIPGGNETPSGRDFPFSYAWSTGETSGSIGVDPPTSTSYSVTVSNACFSDTANILIDPCPSFTGPFAPLIYPNAFTPNGDGLNDVYAIFHLGIGANQTPAYNALRYRFVVYNRWGGEIFEKDGQTTRCAGFSNGEIQWDGRWLNSSAVVPEGVYPWSLDMKNCDDLSTWTRVKIDSVVVVK